MSQTGQKSATGWAGMAGQFSLQLKRNSFDLKFLHIIEFLEYISESKSKSVHFIERFDQIYSAMSHLLNVYTKNWPRKKIICGSL